MGLGKVRFKSSENAYVYWEMIHCLHQCHFCVDGTNYFVTSGSVSKDRNRRRFG
jgi:hypothetical protein